MKLDPLRTKRQQQAVKNWINSGCRGIFSWSTGTGKTIAAILAIKSFLSKNKGKNILVVVPTDYLKMQWGIELAKFNILDEVNIEVINSAIKKEEDVDLLVLDEVHRYLSDSFSNIFNVKNPKLILGLSATFKRLDGKHKHLEKYLPVVDRIDIREALKNNWLSDYREYKVVLDVDNYQEYAEMSREFSESFQIFNYDFGLAMQCLTDFKFRMNYGKSLGFDGKTINAIVFTWKKALHARKNFIINHPKKIEITRKILNARPFSKAITFSGSIKQAEQIKIGKTIHSGKTKKKNRMTLEEFNQLSTGVINSSKALDEGIDIKGLSLAVILSNSSSNNTKVQRIGRIIRKEEGKISEVFTLVLKNTVEERWFQNSSQNSNYIEITEDELDLVLSGENIDGEEQEGKEIDQMFRI